MNEIMKRRGVVFCAVVVMILSGTSAVNGTYGSGTVRSTTAKWTLMMYCAFDNHRDLETNDTIKTFTDIGSDSNLNIVVLLDERAIDDTRYLYIEKNGVVPLSWPESESNMGNPDTLERFLDLTIASYPADHYALFVMSTHGSGWQGAGGDTAGTDSSRYLSLITLPDYTNILKNVTDDGNKKIDLVGYDICVTGSFETAYEIAPYVNYMVSNQEHGFGYGEFSDEGKPLWWNYSCFLQQLKDNPDMTPEQFAISIVDCYVLGTSTSKIFYLIKAPKFYPITKFHTTLSAANLSKANEISTAADVLASVLKDHLSEIKNEIKSARSEVREYGKLYRKFWFLPPRIAYPLQLDPLGYDCFIDLYDFAERLKEKTSAAEIKNACDAVMGAFDKVVIANKAEPTDPSHGFSIYFPELKCQYDQSIWRTIGVKNFRKIPSTYEDLRFSHDTSWDEFLKAYLKI